MIAQVQFKDDLPLGDITLENEYWDDFTSARTSIIEFDDVGNVVSEPMILGLSQAIFDIIPHGLDSYVIFSLVYNNLVDFEPFLGVDIENEYRTYNSLMTVDGDFLDNLVGIKDVEFDETVTFSPNPSNSWDKISVQLPENSIGLKALLRVYNNMGSLLYTHEITNDNFILDAAILATGINHIVIDNGEKLFGNIIIRN